MQVQGARWSMDSADINIIQLAAVLFGSYQWHEWFSLSTNFGQIIYTPQMCHPLLEKCKVRSKAPH